MTPPTRARLSPAWLLLLLMAVASAVAVPAARPAPAPSRFEGLRLAVGQTGDALFSAQVFRSLDAELPFEAPAAAWPPPIDNGFGVGNGDPPVERPVATPFALHQRPPPSLFHA